MPALSSLVVNQKNGMCGTGFGAYHEHYGIYIDAGDKTKRMELENFAAMLRSTCYKKYARPLRKSRKGWKPFYTPIHLEWRQKQGWPLPTEGN